MGNIVLDKSLDFAVRCVRFYNYLREEKHEYVFSLKEARETAYWLLVLYRSELISEAEYKSMNDDLDELISLLTSILKTTKKSTGQKILNS